MQSCLRAFCRLVLQRCLTCLRQVQCDGYALKQAGNVLVPEVMCILGATSITAQLLQSCYKVAATKLVSSECAKDFLVCQAVLYDTELMPFSLTEG
jgi:hypothetical protein